MNTVIRLEDNGQDFLEFVVNDENIIIEAKPFQNSIWSGAYVPLNMVRVGKVLPIHKPPHMEFGFLKHKVESIKYE